MLFLTSARKGNTELLRDPDRMLLGRLTWTVAENSPITDCQHLNCVFPRDLLEAAMDGHLVSVSSNSTTPDALEDFTSDAERWLGALYWSVRADYGDDAARTAAECWLQVFEERLEESSDQPELTGTTVTAIVRFASIP
jgi:hypothetical protein